MCKAGLKDENRNLREQLDTLKRQQSPEERFETRDSKFYLRAPADGQHPGPYCVGCFLQNGKAVPLKTLGFLEEPFGKWTCPVCNQCYP